jgi:predicted nucleic acid-binding protein
MSGLIGGHREEDELRRQGVSFTDSTSLALVERNGIKRIMSFVSHWRIGGAYLLALGKRRCDVHDCLTKRKSD